MNADWRREFNPAETGGGKAKAPRRGALAELADVCGSDGAYFLAPKTNFATCDLWCEAVLR
jgi:hypothetical protein